MKKWTWQWLALLGLAWTILLAVDFVRAELLAPISLKEEDAIEVYHEPLYYDHFLVNIVAPGSPSTAWRIAQQAADSRQPFVHPSKKFCRLTGFVKLRCYCVIKDNGKECDICAKGHTKLSE